MPVIPRAGGKSFGHQKVGVPHLHRVLVAVGCGREQGFGLSQSSRWALPLSFFSRCRLGHLAAVLPGGGGEPRGATEGVTCRFWGEAAPRPYCLPSLCGDVQGLCAAGASPGRCPRAG